MSSEMQYIAFFGYWLPGLAAAVFITVGFIVLYFAVKNRWVYR